VSSFPLPRKGADDNIPNTQYGMTSARFIEMMMRDGVHMNEELDGEPPTNPIMPTQSTVNRPREME